jgi:hypothetical protein
MELREKEVSFEHQLGSSTEKQKQQKLTGKEIKKKRLKRSIKSK